MNKLFVFAFLFSTFLLVSSIVHAAELRGRLTGISGATIQVQCVNDPFNQSVPIGNDGSYAIFGLPTRKSCSFIVSLGNVIKSVPISFSTTRSVTIFNGRLKQQNNIVLVIRQ